jgi:hypothetical protein
VINAATAKLVLAEELNHILYPPSVHDHGGSGSSSSRTRETSAGAAYRTQALMDSNVVRKLLCLIAIAMRGQADAYVATIQQYT